MAKKASQAYLDAPLDYLSSNATRIIVTATEPADRAGAIAGELAGGNISAVDFTKAAGDISGRKTTVAQQVDLAIGTTGEATHVSIISASELMYTTTCTAQQLTSGGTVTVPAWAIEHRAPA